MKKWLCGILSICMAVVGILPVSVCAQGKWLEASSEDIAKLGKELSCDYYFLNNSQYGDIDNLVATVAFGFDNIEFEKSGEVPKAEYNSVLRKFANNNGYEIADTPDPKGIFYDWRYFVIPESTMDYMLTNVFHVLPDHSYYKYNSGYYYNGNYYYQFEGLGGVFPNYEVTDYKRLSDGRYYLTINTTEEFAEYDYPTEYVIAGLQDFGDFTDWTFYKLSSSPIEIPITITYNGENLDFAQEPYINSGTTMVPMRAIFEALGAEVNFDSATKSITANKNGVNIILITGSDVAVIDGKTYSLASPVANVQGTTMVPLRFISEALGAEVQWNGEKRQVSVIMDTEK